MLRISGFLLIVVAILCVLDILKRVQDTEKKLLWIVVVIFLPLVGPILYYAISRGIIRL